MTYSLNLCQRLWLWSIFLLCFKRSISVNSKLCNFIQDICATFQKNKRLYIWLCLILLHWLFGVLLHSYTAKMKLWLWVIQSIAGLTYLVLVRFRAVVLECIGIPRIAPWLCCFILWLRKVKVLTVCLWLYLWWKKQSCHVLELLIETFIQER